MPLIQWPSGRRPVVISEQQTGVTEGNDETQSPISVPRSSRAPKVGATPSATASSSLSVRSESTMQRTSLRVVRCVTAGSAGPRTWSPRGGGARARGKRPRRVRSGRAARREARGRPSPAPRSRWRPAITPTPSARCRRARRRSRRSRRRSRRRSARQPASPARRGDPPSPARRRRGSRRRPRQGRAAA